MRHIFLPSSGPADWRRSLADPEKQWRTGYSAKTLACCWEDADGFPSEITRVFATSGIPAFDKIELLVALPEYQVPLPGGSRPSQSDIFVLAKTADGNLISITIEGKVSEGFASTVGEWLEAETPGRVRRLEYLKEQLGLRQELPPTIRYQLLHRTASAVIEAHRFNCRYAMMMVHSFSQDDCSFEDYQAFLALFQARGTVNQMVHIGDKGGVSIYCGWVRGNGKYLSE